MRLDEYLKDPALRGSASQSGLVLAQQLLLTAVVLQSARAAPVVCTLAWALTVLRSYMIFHDAGHGSFFQRFRGASVLNWATLHVAAVLCGTPTDWNRGHRLHHAHVGNLGQDEYDWGETIFHTKRQFEALPRAKRVLWRAARHPVPFFALAPLLTWYVRMRLPFEARPGRRAAYRLSSKLVSTCFMALRYALAHRHGILRVVFAGDYLAMFGGVVLFHLQHVFDGGYVTDAWQKRDAAMLGSSLLRVPPVLKFFTLGIEYHHVHHFQPLIPGYMLRRAHEGAPASFDDLPSGFGGVRVLDGAAVWRSLQMQCHDGTTFVPFPRE